MPSLVLFCSRYREFRDAVCPAPKDLVPPGDKRSPAPEVMQVHGEFTD